MELKYNEFEKVHIQYPIPYFTKVLQKKEIKFTGKEITNTQIRNYENQQMMLRM